MSPSVDVTYNARIHDEGADGLWAEVLELPGVFASGFTHEELEEALAEAIQLYLSSPGSHTTVTVKQFGPNEKVEERKILVGAG